MSEVTHKAIVIAQQELQVKGAEKVLLKTYGPACGEDWVPGTQIDQRDERVTCGACRAKEAKL